MHFPSSSYTLYFPPYLNCLDLVKIQHPNLSFLCPSRLANAVTLLTRIWGVRFISRWGHWPSWRRYTVVSPGTLFPGKCRNSAWDWPLPIHYSINILSIHTIQSDSGGKINILVGDACHVKKNVNTNKHLIPNVYGDRAVWPGAYCSLHFCLWAWTKSELCKSKVDTRDESLAPILDATVRIKRRDNQHRWTTRHLHKRDATCTEVDGGILAHLTWP